MFYWLMSSHFLDYFEWFFVDLRMKFKVFLLLLYELLPFLLDLFFFLLLTLFKAIDKHFLELIEGSRSKVRFTQSGGSESLVMATFFKGGLYLLLQIRIVHHFGRFLNLCLEINVSISLILFLILISLILTLSTFSQMNYFLMSRNIINQIMIVLAVYFTDWRICVFLIIFLIGRQTSRIINFWSVIGLLVFF